MSLGLMQQNVVTFRVIPHATCTIITVYTVYLNQYFNNGVFKISYWFQNKH